VCSKLFLPNCHDRSVMHAMNMQSANSQGMLKTSVIVRRLNKYASTRKSKFASDKAGVYC